MEQKKETLLIVDDSRFQRAIFKEMLHNSFELIEASNGEECISIIEKGEKKIDIVLLDLVMPGIDGFEVLRRRQSSENFKEIPVIVLTTSEAFEIQVQAFELGANEFILKPVKREIALSRINNVLESKRRMKIILKEQEELKVKAEIDEMTNLLNKTTAEEMITHILTTSPNELHAFLMIDIDNFKAVNDLLGHKVGDHTICVVAGVIAMQFRKSDIVGRIGGDEFAVLMRNISSKEIAYMKAEEIVRTIQYKKNLSIPENITTSIGLAFSDGTEKDYTALFKKADEALYASKKAGKCCYTEYGTEQKLSDSPQTVFVWTDSRNIHSTLEFVYKYPIQVEKISSFDEVHKKFQENPEQVLSVYLDISETEDNGEKILEMVQRESWLKEIPIIAICHEGNLTQIKNAVSTDRIYDLLFAPLETEQLKRRIRELQRASFKKKTNQE